LRGLFFIYRRQDLFIYIGIFSVPLPPGCLPTGAVGAGAFGRKEGGACRLSGVSGASRVLRGLRGKFFFRKEDETTGFLSKESREIDVYEVGVTSEWNR